MKHIFSSAGQVSFGKTALAKTGISLIFYLFNMSSFVMLELFEKTELPSFCGWIFTMFIYGAVFMLTFKPIYDRTGKRLRHTFAVQSGGIFTVLHIIYYFILSPAAYEVYRSIKESFVIPNFSVEQISSARELYNNFDDLSPISMLMFYSAVFLPLLVSFAVSSTRILDSEKNNSN